MILPKVNMKVKLNFWTFVLFQPTEDNENIDVLPASGQVVICNTLFDFAAPHFHIYIHSVFSFVILHAQKKDKS